MEKISFLSKLTKSFFEEMENLPKAKRIYICVAAFFILAGSFVYFSYIPKISKIDELDAEYKRLETELSLAKKRAGHLERYRDEIKMAEAQFRTAMKALPDRKEIPSLLTDISQAGLDAGLEFLLFRPKPEENMGFYAKIPVSIEVVGGFHSVALFFDRVANLSRIVNIKDIKMTLPGDEEMLITSCTAVTYRFVEALN